jgi:hypothetical protein
MEFFVWIFILEEAGVLSLTEIAQKPSKRSVENSSNPHLSIL